MAPNADMKSPNTRKKSACLSRAMSVNTARLVGDSSGTRLRGKVIP